MSTAMPPPNTTAKQRATPAGTDARPSAATNDRELAARIERLLTAEAGIYVAARVEHGVVYLEGLVESAEQVEAASDIVQGLAGVERIENALEVEEFDDESEGGAPSTPEYADREYRMLDGDRERRGDELAPDFSQPFPAVGSDVTSDSIVATEEAIPYVPPTDPVVRPAENDEGLEVVGGFGTTAMDEYPDDLETTALGEAPPGDEDLETRILAELEADAQTTDLLIHVIVRNGIAHLRGRVPTLADAEAAEAVAARVPGIREVVEELDIAGLEE